MRVSLLFVHGSSRLFAQFLEGSRTIRGATTQSAAMAAMNFYTCSRRSMTKKTQLRVDFSHATF
ncbi:MAG: hypothetical protein ABI604_16555, partial [Nitrospirota bacterium]